MRNKQLDRIEVVFPNGLVEWATAERVTTSMAYIRNGGWELFCGFETVYSLSLGTEDNWEYR